MGMDFGVVRKDKLSKLARIGMNLLFNSNGCLLGLLSKSNGMGLLQVKKTD